MKKLLSAFCVLVLCVSLFSGCTLKSDYSEDDYDIIASYMANALLEHDSDFAYRLVKIEKPEEVEAEPVENEVTGKPTDTPDDEPESSKDNKQDDTVDTNKDDDNSKSIPIADVLGIEGIDIKYSGYELCDSYSSESYFSLDAKKGKTLLILEFKLKNVTDADKKVALTPDDVEYYVNISDEKVNPTMTALTNDLLYYEGTIKSSKSKKAVLVFQIDKSETFENVTFGVVSDNGVFNRKIA